MSGDGFVRTRVRVAVSMVAVTALVGAAGMLAQDAGAGTHAAAGFVHVRSHARVTSPIRFVIPGIEGFGGQGPCLGGLCSSPGEPVIAVGPKAVLQTANTAATVYSKTGEKLAEFDFTSFWGPQTQVCGDPRAIYIPSVE